MAVTAGGGAVFDAAATVTAATFTDNFAQGEGGAIYAGAPLTLTASVLTGNRSEQGAGAYLADTMVVTATRFISNTANDSGGALYHAGGGGGRVVNSLFVGNQGYSSAGAALFLAATNVEILHCTIVDTTATAPTALAGSTPPTTLRTTDTMVALNQGAAAGDSRWHPAEEAQPHERDGDGNSAAPAAAVAPLQLAAPPSIKRPLPPLTGR
jgi:predicted outer membrane repeat protein